MTEKSVAVVIVNYESADLLSRFHLDAPPLPHAVYIVVDNSTSSTGRAACVDLAQQLHWTYLGSAGNVGFGAAVNAGFEEAATRGCSHVLLLNPDAMIAADEFIALIDRARASPGAILSPVVRNESGDVWFSGALMNARRGVLHHVTDLTSDRASDWLTAACLLVPVSTWRMVGGFDEGYFLYWEDVEFTSRWRRLGGDLEVVKSISAVHMVGATQQGGGRKSLTYARFNTRNRIRFAARNLPVADLIRWLFTEPRYMLNQARIADRSSGLLAVVSAVAWGAVEGLAQLLPDRRATIGTRRLLAQSRGQR